MNALAQSFQGMSRGRLLALGAVAALVVGFFVFATGQVTAPHMTLLYSNLDFDDSGEIATKLDSMGVPYELQANGTQILVPSERVLGLRMAMAEDGLPGSASVGYEIFDRADSLGTSSLVQNVNMVRALEGELARTIGSFNKIANARVHLVLPRREVFRREQPEPTASVALKMLGTSRLSRSQVAAIQNLVAASVPGLEVTHVTVVDNNGNLLARGGAGEDGAMAVANVEQYRFDYEERLEKTIEELLERSVGIGKVRAEVNAEIDFDRFTENAERYDPDSQVVRSTQTIEEQSDNKDTEGQPPVTVGNNIPDGQEVPASAAQNESRNTSTRIEEVVNYEISRIVTSHIREGGTIKHLSVAVLVDGSYVTTEDGTATYEPRSPEELERLDTLVKTAVGYDAERGDSVEVVNLPFILPEVEINEGEAPVLGLVKEDYFRIIEIIVLGFVAVLVVLLVLRPMMSRLLTPVPVDQGAADGPARIEGPDAAAAQARLPPEVGGAAQRAAKAAIVEEDPAIDVAQIEGRVKTSAVKQIGEIVDKHPEEALSIVRNWLHESA
ncbi:MAG: flagellar basal-body MS-ring/collar protein FliF [Alphaproteobacteria bacterium]